MISLQLPRYKHQLQQVVASSIFNNFTLLAILLNSIALACTDYRHVDDNYQPRTDGSLRNDIIEKAEIVFTVIFIVECLLKSIAYGFIRGKKAYLKDGWNVFDFIIVAASVLNFVPGVPNLSVIRGCRVLRPLRSISRLPNLRKIINALVGSLSELANAMVLLLFILVCFSLFGMLSWGGLFHYRCRLTPFPVKMPTTCRSIADACWNDFLVSVINDPDAYRCLPIHNDDSMWQIFGPQDCIWPIDETDMRVCSDVGRGLHSCFGDTLMRGMGGEVINVTERRCGSNYDVFGYPRFIDSLEPYHSFSRMEDATFNSAVDYGLTNFDAFSSAFVTAFQIITLEGWSTIMDRVIDSWWTIPAILSFTLLIVLGGFISVNILLAVIAGALEREEEEEISVDQHQKVMPIETSEEDERPAEYSIVAHTIHDIVQSRIYSNVILFVVIANTIILSADHFGISDVFQTWLDTANFVTTIIFFADMVLHCIGLGLWKYWSHPSTCFDGTIALVSMIEVIALRVGPSGSSKSSISAFRSLRLLRLLKMVKQWTSIHQLLATIARAASAIRSFGILLVLFIFIYALVGMQLFANRLHFDEFGAPIAITDSNYNASTVPRSNFDDFFNAVTTVFQVLTLENWNEVMHDCWRATSWVAPVYFILLIVQGVFVVLSLFLAILIRQFDGSDLVSSSRRISPEKEYTNKMKDVLDSYTEAPKSRGWGRSFSSTSLYIRERMLTIVQSKRFENILTAAIVISSIVLALDNPLRDPASSISHTLHGLNVSFALLFIVEFVVKVLAYGPWQYFRDTWNLLDFTCVVASVMDMLNVSGGSALRLVRMIRITRSLRMINRSQLKVVVEALLLSLPSVVNVGAVFSVFMLVFAIFGVTFLKGTFYECATSNLTMEQIDLITYPKSRDEMSNLELSWLSESECGTYSSPLPSSKVLCQCMNATWVQTIPQNFDNIFSSFSLLFEISTTEGWVDVMNAAIDQRGIDMQPVRDNNRAWTIFFVFFILIGSFFLLELFVGAIVENFSHLRESRGYGLMTEAQRKWAATQAFVMRLRPERLLRRPEQRLRARCYDVAMSPWFERFVVFIITSNCITIATLSSGDNEMKTRVVETLNGVFSTMFAAEVLLKILAFGHLFFRFRWNQFDFALVCGIVASFLLRLVVVDQKLVASVAAMVSLLRIGRLVRLVKRVKQLRLPFNTIIAVTPSIINVGGLLLLLFFIYASIGVELYAMIRYEGGLNEQSNFRSIGNAMQLLMKFSTGESWNGFMYDMLEERVDCDPNPIYNEISPWCLVETDYPDCTEINGCGAGYSVFIYFYSFTLIVSYIILNLVVGVVLEAFENSSEGGILHQSDLDNFVKTWALFDPEATWYMKASDVQSFFARLEPPLRPGLTSEVSFVKEECLLGIGVNDNLQVHILDVANHLAKRLALQKQGLAFGELSDNHPVRVKLRRLSSDMTTNLNDFYFSQAGVILRAVRRFRQHRKHRPPSPSAIA